MLTMNSLSFETIAQPKLPIVIFTADVTERTTQMCYEAGVCTVLSKPVTAPVLVAAIRDALSLSNPNGKGRLPLSNVLEQLRSMRFLLVDDAETNLVVLRHVLSRNLTLGNPDKTVWMAGSAAEALRLVREQAEPFDFVLCDVQMPLVDGIATAEAMYQLPASKQPRAIIGVTGHDDKPTHRRCLKAGMVGVIVKPVRWHELLAMFRRALGCDAIAHTAIRAASTSAEQSGSRSTNTPPPTRSGESIVAASKFARFALFDNSVLSMFDDEQGSKLISTWHDDVSERCTSLQRALVARDWTNLASHLHSIKGSSVQLGFLRLSRTAQHAESMLEQSRKRASAKELSDALQVVEAVFRHSVDAVAKMYDFSDASRT